VIEQLGPQGDTPVAVLKQVGARTGPTAQLSINNAYADQIDTVRVITRGSDEVVLWRWDAAEAFGNSLPQQDPSGLGAFVFDHRMPGQIYDAETGNFQNANRDYRASTGSYAQNDPIGLAGGINPYAYVGGQPTRFSDPLGLWSPEAHNYFLMQAFPGLDPAMMSALQAGSEAADSMKYQDAEHVYMHAMSSSKVSPAESRRQMCEFIKNKRELYQLYVQHGLPYNAFFVMGMALHPAMDATSPAHRGFQEWRWRDAGKHGPNKAGMIRSMEDVDTAVRYRDETLQLMQKAFTGQRDCSCL